MGFYYFPGFYIRNRIYTDLFLFQDCYLILITHSWGSCWLFFTVRNSRFWLVILYVSLVSYTRPQVEICSMLSTNDTQQYKVDFSNSFVRGITTTGKLRHYLCYVYRMSSMSYLYKIYLFHHVPTVRRRTVDYHNLNGVTFKISFFVYQD